MTATLLDQIYECAFLPELWPPLLDRLAQIAGGLGGHLFMAGHEVLDWTASAILREGMERIVPTGLMTRGQRPVRLLRARHAGFLTEHDLFTEPEMADDPLYRDRLWPRGLGWAASTAVALPTGNTVFLTIERTRARGPVEPPIVEQLDALRPHLARAMLLAARLHLERARAVSQTLSSIGLAALVFGASGTVLAANDLIEALKEHVQWRARDCVRLSDGRANTLLERAVADLDTDRVSAIRSFALRGTDGSAVLVAHVIPIRGDARDVFGRAIGVLVLTPVTAVRAPAVELVQSLFDMTPAEARVARSLATGDTIGEIAAGGKVSRNTVRTHVRGVLEKTGCRRQAEVVALLSGIAVRAA